MFNMSQGNKCIGGVAIAIIFNEEETKSAPTSMNVNSIIHNSE